jgi:hypothetical protein
MKGMANLPDFSSVACPAERLYLFESGRISNDFFMALEGVGLSVLRQEVTVGACKGMTGANGFDPLMTCHTVGIVDLFRGQGADGHHSDTDKDPHGQK